MSNGSDKSGNSGEWTMPEPVFRSSDGIKLGGSSVDNAMASDRGTEPHKIMENEPSDVAKATIDPQGESAMEKEAKGDKLGASMTLVGILALLGAAILFALVYFMFFWGQTPSPS
jgi:hypothetical protein